jgi:hypothetical protein
MTVERLDSVSYNQVGAREMRFFFTDGEISRNEAHGNVYVIYFMTEDDGYRIGVNYTETTQMKMYITDKKVQKIWMPPPLPLYIRNCCCLRIKGILATSPGSITFAL